MSAYATARHGHGTRRQCSTTHLDHDGHHAGLTLVHDTQGQAGQEVSIPGLPWRSYALVLPDGMLHARGDHGGLHLPAESHSKRTSPCTAF